MPASARAKAHGVLPWALVDLVTAGYSVGEALATATSGAAESCGIADETGRLAPGSPPTFSSWMAT